MEKIYKSLDNFLLGCTNKVTQACNYTFGWSRNDLANLLQVTAPVFEISGNYHNDPSSAAFYIPAFVLMSMGSISLFTDMDSEDKESSRKGCKRNPIYDVCNNIMGWSMGSAAILEGTPIHGEDNLHYAIIGIGHAIRSLSHYVIRLPDIPRRKSVFTRAFEKLYLMVPRIQLQRQEIRV